MSQLSLDRARQMAAFHRTFIQPPADRPDLLPVDAWLWEPWEYATTGPNTLHRADPARPGTTLCGCPYLGLLGTPAWAKVPHCPACVAAPEPDHPAEFWRLEFARYRRIGAHRADVVAICHTADTDPIVWEELPAHTGAHRDVTDVATGLGWGVEYGPHYDPRTGTTWARVSAPDWVTRPALF